MIERINYSYKWQIHVHGGAAAKNNLPAFQITNSVPQSEPLLFLVFNEGKTHTMKMKAKRRQTNRESDEINFYMWQVLTIKISKDTDSNNSLGYKLKTDYANSKYNYISIT